jgi:2-polyprenyl-3-methyl-5-hydroxy-6-metoxy-1,4-benzoquinol methylase
MTLTKNESCPLCSSTAFVPHRFGLLRCTGCGLVVDRRIFTPELDQQLNEEAFGEGYEPERSFWVRWFQSWKNRRYLANLRRAGVKKGRLLEIGVGSGSFLRAAREAGFDAMGCDLSESLARRVHEQTGVPVHCGDLARLPSQAFDIVCMHHVLEHVRDPVGFLRAARERLKPGGMLHLAVPNGACWEARLSGWNCYVYYHLVYFDRSTLRRAAERAGFEIDRLTSHESFSTWLLTLLRTAARIRAMEAPPEVAASLGRVPSWWPLVEHPYRLAMAATGLATWPLRALQGRLGYGDELLLIARREND